MIVLGVFVLLLFFFSLVSKRSRSTIITAPMLFTGAGVLLSILLPQYTDINIKDKAFLVVSEITLALVLFADATHIDPRKVIREYLIPSRLLTIGMPLTIIAGAVAAAVLFTDLDIWEAAILGIILAPTDASLGVAVVTSQRVPARIRQALSLESGLNDGLAIPLLMLFVALARVESPTQDTSWILYTLRQIGFGLLVGLISGWLGGWLMANASKRSWMTRAGQQLALLALAVIAWWLAEKVVGGNGFIAAFTAGVMVRFGFEDAKQPIVEFSGAFGDLLVSMIFFVFGISSGILLSKMPGRFWLYAVLSLTFVRMIPVSISLIKTRLHFSSTLFLGWFGPRGLASIVLGLVFLEQEAHLPGEPVLELAIVATVMLSIFAHGISTAPGINLYGRQMDRLPPESPEKKEIAEDPRLERIWKKL